MKVRPLIERLFAVPEKERRWWEIILWWELRRFLYNAIVGAFGLFWLVAFAVVNELPPQLPFEERDWEPLSVVIFAIAVNVFYTGGWMAELIVRRLWREKAHWLGPQLLFLGLIISLAALPLPAVADFLRWLWRVLHT